MARTTSEYMAGHPKLARSYAKKMRAIILKAMPKCEEAIKWGVPTFMLNGKNVVLFGTFKKHIGFFPGPEVILKFKKDLSAYRTSKGTIQFPFDKPLPTALITRIVKYSVKSRAKNKRL